MNINNSYNKEDSENMQIDVSHFEVQFISIQNHHPPLIYKITLQQDNIY